jgi:phthalate 4,5-dioxygenase oxygenase subunit
MLTQEQNETLTRTGPGTPMGRLFRQFWLPVLLSRELAEPDGAPKRVRILGEDLIAFRDTQGRVGLVEPRCPHRGANLFFGRNEACGLRCAYHGWKFDVNGDCQEIPTMPQDASSYQHVLRRAKIVAYPTREYGGFVWGWFGPSDAAAPLPEMEFALLAPAHRFVSKKLQECNWAQAAEGAIDTAHFSFLHTPVGETAVAGLTRGYAPQTMGASQIRWMKQDGAPRYTVARHDAGLVLAGARHADGQDTYWRIAQYLMPNHAYAPGTAAGETYHGQTWVPIDDENCWVFTYSWNPDRPLSERERESFAQGASIHAAVDGNYVPLANRGNDYLIDRLLQKHETFSGIKGISEQDAAIQDSQGRIHDRTREMLSPTDLGIAQFRVLMLRAAQALAAGQGPAAAAQPGAYRVRAGAIVAPNDLPFDQVMLRRFGDVHGRFDTGRQGPKASAAA